MIPSFHPDMSLSEIVQQTPSGVVFLQNQSHWGSYQLLTRAMPKFKKVQVKHFYLEISQRFFQEALDAHFTSGGKSQSLLDRAFRGFLDIDQRTHLRALVLAAHSEGIKVLAVDTKEVCMDVSHATQDKQSFDRLRRENSAHNPLIVQIIQSHMRQLTPEERYIGLFGGSRSSIGQKLNALLVRFHAMPLEGGKTHLHNLPTLFRATDVHTLEILQQCHILTFVPHQLEDNIDLFHPKGESQTLLFLNRLLQALSLPECQAFHHTSSQKISAALFVKREEVNPIWIKAVTCIDLDKRLDTSDPNRAVIVFNDIERGEVRTKIMASLLQLQKKKMTA